MEFTQIIFEISNHGARITLNRPDMLNAFSDIMRQEIKDSIDIINKERNIRVVTITGAGKAFSAGGDVKAMAERTKLNIPFQEHRDTQRWRTGDTIRKIKSIRQPVIAVLNGAAAGAGFGLALACDLRIASDKAKMALSFVKRGLAPDWGVSYFLPRLVGTARALELTCTGKTIDAETALRFGLVNTVVQHEELEGYVENICNEIAENAPIAVNATKDLIYYGAISEINSTLEYEAYIQSMCHLTEDHKEGALAFIEKRPPSFKGQ